MALVKCPRCELNYMNDTDEMCSVCRREVRGESEQFDMIELCSECGENPVVPGYELCAGCLKELQRRTAAETTDEAIVHDDPNIGIDSVRMQPFYLRIYRSGTNAAGNEQHLFIL